VTGYLLDTNVIAELRKGRRANPRVRAWLDPIDANQLYLSVLTIGEVRKGIDNIRRRDAAAAASLERWSRRLVTGYGDRILGVDTAVAEEWGRLQVPDPLPVIDSLLAATARVHGLVLATRNVKDVESTGVEVVNPFADPQ
jgi:toxin FitB